MFFNIGTKCSGTHVHLHTRVSREENKNFVVDFILVTKSYQVENENGSPIINGRTPHSQTMFTFQTEMRKFGE